MATKFRWAENYSACRMQLDFTSLIRMSGVIGLCSGAGFIPLILYLNTATVAKEPASIVFVILIAPLIGALNGAVSGLIGYPLYKWWSQRTKGQTFTGIFVGLVADSGEV